MGVGNAHTCMGNARLPKTIVATARLEWCGNWAVTLGSAASVATAVKLHAPPPSGGYLGMDAQRGMAANGCPKHMVAGDSLEGSDRPMPGGKALPQYWQYCAFWESIREPPTLDKMQRHTASTTVGHMLTTDPGESHRLQAGIPNTIA